MVNNSRDVVGSTFAQATEDKVAAYLTLFVRKVCGAVASTFAKATADKAAAPAVIKGAFVITLLGLVLPTTSQP